MHTPLEYRLIRFFPRGLLLLTFISLCVRICASLVVQPGFDEAYYFVYSRYPALSYFDHPPVVGLCAGLGPWLLGAVTSFTLRLCTLILFSADTVLIYWLARQFGSHKGALCAAAIFTVTPLFFIISGISVVPDGPLIFFWLITLLCFVPLVRDDAPRPWLWIAAGLATGCAFLSKYHGAFLGILLWTYLLCYRPRRFFRPGPYIYALCALTLALPVVIWNMHHEWASFAFQGGRAIGSSVKPLRFLEALGGQALYCTPMLFVPFVVIMWRSLRFTIAGSHWTYRFIFFFGTIPVVLFLGVSFFKSILPHWTLPGYAAVIAGTGPWLARALRGPRIRVGAIITVVFVASLYVLVVLHTHYGILHLEKLEKMGWISSRDVRNDPTLDTYGWEGVSHYLSAQGITPQTHMLCAHKWFLCGEIAFATSGRYPVVCLNQGDARGFWIWNAHTATEGKDAICIATSRYRADSSYFASFFERLSSADTVVLYRGGVVAKRIYFYKGYGFKKKKGIIAEFAQPSD